MELDRTSSLFSVLMPRLAGNCADGNRDNLLAGPVSFLECQPSPQATKRPRKLAGPPATLPLDKPEVFCRAMLPAESQFSAAREAVPLLSRPQAAALLGVQPDTLAAWASNQRVNIPVVKVGRRSMYRIADLEKFCTDHLRNAAGTKEAA